ncbi:hypothetical protein [Methylococcus mesophilus]|uniref:hypothetical protein n=1 Tax=Methylococcus mesophilus TaxID=2993564 RepID=UPI00224B77B4|nr:hypothetical protein [Methylococcus mesophilus]UZR30725.1 hypothetical protein OOT43_08895 [Methylococcus mesophilus]
MRYVPICDGLLVDTGGPVSPTCAGTWLLNIDASGIPGAFDISTLDPIACLSAFSSGFVIVGSVLLVGLAVAMVLDAIRGDRRD